MNRCQCDIIYLFLKYLFVLFIADITLSLELLLRELCQLLLFSSCSVKRMFTNSIPLRELSFILRLPTTIVLMFSLFDSDLLDIRLQSHVVGECC